MILVLVLSVGVIAGVAAYLGMKKISPLIEDQAREKAVAMEKIREYFERMSEGTNDDIQKITGVSDATATRYLEELEQAGEIRQVGTVGKSVKYERVNH